MTNILSRLERLERSSPDTKKQHRVIRLVASEEEGAEAERLLEAEGFDPDSGVAIIRLICGPSGGEGERYNKPPYILSDTGNAD